MNLGAAEIALIVLAVFLLFGYKKLPDASRSLGRSLRIFKGEMGGMKDDDARASSPATPVPAPAPVSAPVQAPVDAAALEREATAAETAALEARARAARAHAEAQPTRATS
ncbi:Sec-independent protein translocase subunit TatA [Modestobacter sp. Leaf380]|uniref:Sec-independent protein translocase subunit TatA n=1 Tax=Modestobacter sp. Leaf380 TaxID=1736356 RepID=UPI0006F6363A|nr:Sec-independent protein translocase subunit TatA [Modestobacter sp. Leaf380]KQS66574.1 translocase [Modestobacter sp. Leaf380]